MASDVTLTGALGQAQKTGAQSVKLAEDFDQFLTLLTTQLQNQDPLDPMDSTEFTNQIVQFSQVEQSINTNQKLDNLVSLQLASISSVALGYVGMDVSYVSAELNYDGSDPVKVNYALSDGALQAKINIYNEAGDLVYSGEVPADAGAHEFVWDGRNNGGEMEPEGTYSVSIDAIDTEQNPIDTSTVVSGHVRGIESQNGIIFVLIGDRAVPISSIINATVPEDKPATTDTGDSGGTTTDA